MGATIQYFASVINFLILVRIIISWITRDFSNPIVRFVFQITEPILAPFRELLNKLGLGGSMFDFSAIFAIITINTLASMLANILR